MNNYKEAIEFVIENKTDWKRTCINLIQNHPSVFMKVAVVEGEEEKVVEEKKVEGLTKEQFVNLSYMLKSDTLIDCLRFYRNITGETVANSKRTCDAIKAGLVEWED